MFSDGHLDIVRCQSLARLKGEASIRHLTQTCVEITRTASDQKVQDSLMEMA